MYVLERVDPKFYHHSSTTDNLGLKKNCLLLWTSYISSLKYLNNNTYLMVSLRIMNVNSLISCKIRDRNKDSKMFNILKCQIQKSNLNKILYLTNINLFCHKPKYKCICLYLVLCWWERTTLTLEWKSRLDKLPWVSLDKPTFWSREHLLFPLDHISDDVLYG